MHSRIFCMVETPKTNNNYEEQKEEILDLSDYNVAEDMSSVADYVSDDTNLQDDISWLKDYLKEQNLNIFNFTSETTFTLNFQEIEKYFEEKIKKLKEKINNIQNVKDFFDNSYDIKELLNDEFGYYFMPYIYDYETFDDFLEQQLEYGKDIDTEFEIVKTFDYHW